MWIIPFIYIYKCKNSPNRENVKSVYVLKTKIEFNRILQPHAVQLCDIYKNNDIFTKVAHRNISSKRISPELGQN